MTDPETLEQIAARLHEDYCVEHEEDCTMQRAIAAALRQQRAEGRAEAQLERCSCEIDRHDFDCPMHNDHSPERRRGPNGDE